MREKKIVAGNSSAGPPTFGVNIINIMFTPKCHEKPLSATAQLLLRLKDFDETKRTSHHPWCGDDTYALAWGVIKPRHGRGQSRSWPW